MSDGKQLKTLGLRFARALQMTIKTAVMFTLEHKSVERPVQQSFLLLNNLLKETGQFTFGFVDNQVLLNNILTSDTSLRQLETEFLKRGIAAVTFEPGLTLARYKKVISIISAPGKTIDEAGGLFAFLDQNEVEGVRILPAAKNQKKDEHGDTIIETDSEAYILSKQMAEDQAPRDFLDSIDALLESACFDPSMRTEVLSDFATRGMDGSGYGVPIGMPNLAVVNEGEMVVPASTEPGAVAEGGPTDGGGQVRYAAAGQGAGAGGAWSGGRFTSPGASAAGNVGAVVSGAIGSVSYASQGSAEPAGGIGTGSSARGKGVPGKPGPATFMELVESSVQRSLLEEKGDPQKSYASLARILRNTGVDKILAQFPADRREELSSLPPEQLAAEYIEDTALQLAGAKLKSASGESGKLLIEEEVVHLLARSLQATHMADRLAQKLTKFIQDFAVPAHVQEKIRQELQWTVLNSSKKYARLMEIKHYSPLEFRRLMDLAKELVTQRDMDRASALASHYFDFLDQEGVGIDNLELSRAPELIRAIPLAHVGLASKTAERLGRTVLRDDVPEFIHFQAASALAVLARSIAVFENFQDVLAIGISLDTSYSRNPEKHQKCCGTVLARLLPAAAIERIIELFVEQRGDSAWGKTAATLLRFAAPASIESVFNLLVREADARNRLALVRLVSQLGKESIEAARKYLTDERWYVVRNMCGVLAELKDPELVAHIAPALQHPDARVQQAALKALVKSRSVDAARVLASSLSTLASDILNEALDELMFLKDGSTTPILESFVRTAGGNLASSRKAVQALACVRDDAALHALSRLFRTEELDIGIRRAALTGISKHPSPLRTKMLQEFATNWGDLAEEARIELEKHSSG